MLAPELALNFEQFDQRDVVGLARPRPAKAPELVLSGVLQGAVVRHDARGLAELVDEELLAGEMLAVRLPVGLCAEL